MLDEDQPRCLTTIYVTRSPRCLEGINTSIKMAALRSFALKVVTKLRDEVIVAKVGTFGFCMALVANLEEAEIWLDSGPDEHRVRELLSHLDGLIQVRNLSSTWLSKRIVVAALRHPNTRHC